MDIINDKFASLGYPETKISKISDKVQRNDGTYFWHVYVDNQDERQPFVSETYRKKQLDNEYYTLWSEIYNNIVISNEETIVLYLAG